MPADRFRFIEGSGSQLPEDLKKSLSNLGRFGSLELPGQLPPEAKTGKECPGCQALNEPGALECRACRRVLEPEPKLIPHGAELAVVLDGQTYKSSDPNLPEDIAVLLKQIREKGYSSKLLAQWRSWRATRRSTKAKPVQAPKPVPVLRINGRLLRWSDAELPQDLRILFAFIASQGVSGALLNHLGELGYEASYDPKAEGGLGLLEVRTGPQPMSGLQKRALRFVVAGAACWLILRPFASVMPETLSPLLYLVPLGMAVSWALR